MSTFKHVQTPTMSTMVKTDSGSWSSYVTITATTAKGEHKRAAVIEMVLEWDGYIGIQRAERWTVLRTTMTTNRSGAFIIPTPLATGTLRQVTDAAVKVAQRQARREQAEAIAECSGAVCAA